MVTLILTDSQNVPCSSPETADCWKRSICGWDHPMFRLSRCWNPGNTQREPWRRVVIYRHKFGESHSIYWLHRCRYNPLIMHFFVKILKFYKGKVYSGMQTGQHLKAVYTFRGAVRGSWGTSLWTPDNHPPRRDFIQSMTRIRDGYQYVLHSFPGICKCVQGLSNTSGNYFPFEFLELVTLRAWVHFCS